jgi:lantibiotic modifying enzyme
VGDRLASLTLVDTADDRTARRRGSAALLKGHHWTLTPAGLGLYSGLPGIAMFTISAR